MSWRFYENENIDFIDLMRLATKETQICTAQQVVDYFEQVDNIKSNIRAYIEARDREDQEKVRREIVQLAKRDRLEALRHQQNRRLSTIAIWIAAISLLVAVFK